jgi:hypothetical protein
VDDVGESRRPCLEADVSNARSVKIVIDYDIEIPRARPPDQPYGSSLAYSCHIPSFAKKRGASGMDTLQKPKIHISVSSWNSSSKPDAQDTVSIRRRGGQKVSGTALAAGFPGNTGG